MVRHIFAIAILLMAAAVMAGPAVYTVHLTGSAEVPPTGSKAQGELILKISGDTAAYKLIVANIVDVSAAHLHLGPSTDKGPVVVNLFLGPTKEGRFSGVLAEGTFTASDLVGPLAGVTWEDFIARLEAGDIYVNAHTATNPGGEIRAQIE